MKGEGSTRLLWAPVGWPGRQGGCTRDKRAFPECKKDVRFQTEGLHWDCCRAKKDKPTPRNGVATKSTQEKRETNRRVLDKKDLEEYFLIPERYDTVQWANESGCGSLSLGSWEKRTDCWYSFGTDWASWSEPSESSESSSEFLGVLRPSSFKLLSSCVSQHSTSSPWPPFSALLGSLERKASANH